MSDILFAKPSILEGMGSVLDVFGIYETYNTSDSPTDADLLALRADWEAIGKDLKASLAQFKQENNAR